MSTVSLPHSRSQSQGSAALSGPGGMIACMICLAAYAPSRGYPQLANAPTVVIESAFMSMCRFCFRCRRPACPSCWDEVNGVCGACVEETHLSFRAEPPSLAGVVLPPAQAAQQKALAVPAQRVIAPFVCVQLGRFHKPDSAPMAVAPMISAHGVAAATAKTAIVQGHHPKQQTVQQQETHQVWEIATRPASHRVAVAEHREADAEDEQDYEGQEALPASRLVRAAEVVERVLTIVVLIILIAIALLIVAALVSFQANTIIANSLNIDIRAEIAYLLQLIQQLHL